MRYIKSVELKNFQGYKNETIPLGPGLNLLLGSSDSGKSSVLRAISFVLYNYPRNSTLIHEGETETSVTLEFSDGVKVTRLRSDEKNAYLTNQKDKNGKLIELDRIDKAVPDEIKKLLNHPPEDDFNGFISYADQFSKMFLVDLSPTDLPRSLSNLTGIEIFEESAKQLMQSYKAIEKETKADEKSYDKLVKELDSYSFIEEYEIKIDSFNGKLKKLEDLQEQFDALNQIHSTAGLDISTDCVDGFSVIIKNADVALAKIKKVQNKIAEYDKLQIFAMVTGNGSNSVDPIALTSVLTKIDLAMKKIKETNAKLSSYISYENVGTSHATIKASGAKLSEEYKTVQSELIVSESDLATFKKFLIDEKIQCEKCGSILQ